MDMEIRVTTRKKVKIKATKGMIGDSDITRESAQRIAKTRNAIRKVTKTSLPFQVNSSQSSHHRKDVPPGDVRQLVSLLACSKVILKPAVPGTQPLVTTISIRTCGTPLMIISVLSPRSPQVNFRSMSKNWRRLLRQRPYNDCKLLQIHTSGLRLLSECLICELQRLLKIGAKVFLNVSL